jgi:hypothetical protein
MVVGVTEGRAPVDAFERVRILYFFSEVRK